MKFNSIFSFLWFHIKPYKWFYLIMLMAPLVSSFHAFVYNYAVKLFIDAMEFHEFNYAHILFPIFLFLGAELILDLAWRISNIAGWKSEPYVRRSILLKSYDYVQHHSYKFFQENFTGTVISKVKALLDGYDKIWSEIHHGLSLKIMSIIVCLCALTIVSVNLGIFVFIWAFIYILMMYKFSNKLNSLSFEETESRHALIGQISDKISNIISLFSFSSRDKEYLSLDKLIKNDFIPKQIHVYRYHFRVDIIAGILYLIMFSFILFYMIYLRKIGAITIGDFAFVFGLSMVIAENIWHVTIRMQDLARMMGDLRSALSIIQAPQQNLDKKDAKALVVKSPTIQFRNVRFRYDQTRLIFQDLNLDIKAGEKIGLVGHSGAGKSSIINLLLRYFKKDGGQILIDGHEVDDLTQDSIRENIAVIPQDTLLFHRNLMENIRYGRGNATDKEVINASKEAHIHEFIETLPEGYNTLVGERGVKLSGGQRQRIAIARAILKNAPILILDEATSSLDSHTEQLIQESLNLLIEDKKKTVIAIAHRLSTLKHMDRILVLDKGKIIEEGSHDFLISEKRGFYKKLWEIQAI